MAKMAAQVVSIRDMLSWNKVFDVSLMESKSENKQVRKDVNRMESHLASLERAFEKENYGYEEARKKVEKERMDAKTVFEKEHKYKQELNAKIEKLKDACKTVTSETAKTCKILSECKRSKNIYDKLTTLGYQENQVAKVLSPGKQNGVPPESAIGQELGSSQGRVLPPSREDTNSSTHHTLVTKSKLDSDSSKCEGELEHDISLVSDGMERLTGYVLHQVQSRPQVKKALRKHKQELEKNLKKCKQEEELLELQINDRKERKNKMTKEIIDLGRKCHLFNRTLKDDHQRVLDCLGNKVTELYKTCLDKRNVLLNTMEKLARTEYAMIKLIEKTEEIPEESLKKQKKVKDNERRRIELYKKKELEWQMQREREEKCRIRTQADVKKIQGRRLLPRSITVDHKIKVSNIPVDIPEEDEDLDDLFDSEKTVKSNMNEFYRAGTKQKRVKWPECSSKNTGESLSHKVDQKPTCIPTKISEIDRLKLKYLPLPSAAGQHCSHAGADGTHYHAKGEGKSLLSLETVQPQPPILLQRKKLQPPRHQPLTSEDSRRH